jgi:GH25 family lysozyme M1 (1,4-beta-N-acetylmuramidase)
MSMKGIDISHWQDGIDLTGVPCDFVIIKATQGTSFVDECCDKFYQEAKKLGKKLGVYHFADGKSTGKQEADHFIKNVKGYIGEAILVLDWEADALKKGTAYAKEFLDRVFEKTGVRPLIYMSKSVCREYDWTDVVNGNYGLWMAQYANKEITGYQDKPWTDGKGMGAFKKCAIHQFTSSGRLGNYSGNLDLDIAYMTAKAWDKYAKPSEKVSVPGNCFPKYTGTTYSIVNALQTLKIDSNYNYRKSIAKINGISDYSGTPEQNTKMLNLLKEGKLVKP